MLLSSSCQAIADVSLNTIFEIEIDRFCLQEHFLGLCPTLIEDLVLKKKYFLSASHARLPSTPVVAACLTGG